MDTDLRHPSVPPSCGLEKAVGLTSVLAGEASTVAQAAPAVAASPCNVVLGYTCSGSGSGNSVTFTVAVIGPAPESLSFSLTTTGGQDSVTVTGAGATVTATSPTTYTTTATGPFTASPAPLATVSRAARNCGTNSFRAFSLSLDSGTVCTANPISFRIEGCTCPA